MACWTTYRRNRWRRGERRRPALSQIELSTSSSPGGTSVAEFASLLLIGQNPESTDHITGRPALTPLTVNETDGYLWDTFRPRLVDAFKALMEWYPTEVPPLRLNQIVLRYIDSVSRAAPRCQRRWNRERSAVSYKPLVARRLLGARGFTEPRPAPPAHRS